ncbi:MAG: AI-2E family transporter [Turicibacter sp.]|nr:AI-2E family transporter [Turicibacter sp.]
MNWRFWNRRYYLATIYTLIIILISITYWKSFESTKTLTIMPLLWPFIIGLAVAFLLNFLLRFYERKITKRAFSLLAVYVTVTLLISAFIFFLAPQVTRAMEHFIEEFPDYSEMIVDEVEVQLSRFDLTDDHVEVVTTNMNRVIDRFVTFNKNLVPTLMEHVVVIGETLTHIVLGIVLSIYILASKETLRRQFSRLIQACAGPEKSETILTWLRKANRIFAKFFAGMAINSLIVGVLTIVLLFIFRIPFAILIGFIVALTNIIPIFGPLIGAVPSAVMIFFISPTKALIFTGLILVIQQVDANIITPKILGDKIGISSIWVLVAILVFGYFFGIAGMILGVPFTALLFEISREIISAKIDKGAHKADSKRVS